MGTRFCPRCGSTDVQSDLSTAAFAQGSIFNKSICNNCGYEGNIFPEAEKIKKKNKK